MYQVIRKTHLVAALILFVFILLYAVSGYLLEFPAAWPLGPGKSTTQRIAFHPPAGLDSPGLANYIKQTFGLHGQLKYAKIDRRTGRRDWTFVGPKAFYEASLPGKADQITITTQPCGFYAMLNRFHHLSGFSGGPIYVTWGVMFDLVCIAMILFAFSGVYLWYKMTKRHTLGWIMLGSSIAYTVATALYCVFSR